MSIIVRAILYALATGILIVSACNTVSHDEGIEWHEEDISDYVVYTFEIDSDTLNIIEVGSGDVLRQITDYSRIQTVASSRDGSRLYISTADAASSTLGLIIEVDTKTWESTTLFNGSGHLFPNRGDHVYFVAPPIQDSAFTLYRIDPQSGQYNAVLTFNAAGAGHSAASLIQVDPARSRVVAVRPDGEGIFVKDVETEILVDTGLSLSFPPLARIAISGGGDTLAIPEGPVIDLSDHRIIGQLPVWRLGRALFRSDNKEVYVTDPGGYLKGPSPSGSVKIYSPRENRIVGHIDVQVRNQPRLTDRIYLTDRQRYAVVSDRMASLFVLDLKTRKVIQHHEFVSNNTRTHSMEYIYLARRPHGL